MTPAQRRKPFVPRGTTVVLYEIDPWREASLSRFLREEGYEVLLKDPGEFTPQVAVVDFRDGTGEVRTRYDELRARFPEMKTVAFVSEVKSATVFPCLLLGIKGVLPATADGNELLLALAAVREGSLWTPRAVLSEWIDRISTLAVDGGVERAFTRAEQRVLGLLKDELTNKEIARRLGLAEATVKFHIGRLLKKTATKDRRELIRFLVESPLHPMGVRPSTPSS